MTIQIDAIYQQRYLNLLSAVIKQLHIPQTINQPIPYNPQCLTTPGDAAHLILLDMLSGRQALVHLESWAAEVDLEKLLSSGAEARHFNDDAIGRLLDRLHDGNIPQIYSQLVVDAFQKEDISSLHVFIAIRQVNPFTVSMPVKKRERKIFSSQKDTAVIAKVRNNSNMAPLSMRVAFRFTPMSMTESRSFEQGLGTT